MEIFLLQQSLPKGRPTLQRTTTISRHVHIESFSIRKDKLPPLNRFGKHLKHESFLSQIHCLMLLPSGFAVSCGKATVFVLDKVPDKDGYFVR